MAPEEKEIEARKDALTRKKEHEKELEKRYPKNVSQTVSDEKSNEGKKKSSANGHNQPRRQLKQISSEEVGRVNRPIEDEPYYHGFMTRSEADKLLRREGEFLGKFQFFL